MNILIYTLGCPKNFNDSQVAAGLLEAAGHRTIMANDDMSERISYPLDEDSMAKIDAILVNTCGFIEDAKTESIEAIFTMAGFEKPLIVSGCLPQRYGEELYREIPEVDLFVGVNEYERLPSLLEDLSKRQLVVEPYTEELEAPYRKIPEDHWSASLKISEGCDNHCTFCAIPAIRGPYRSRPKEAIVEEAASLAAQGVKELILIAQDTTTYGKDLYGSYALADLVEDLCQIDGIHWIRLMYCYEDRITDDLIRVIQEQEKVCAYLDVPLQHIADPILRSMGRRSTGDGTRAKIKKLRAEIPDLHLRTTLIVGFPGESEEDFEELLEFVQDAEFERLGVFRYSPEDNTPAASMEPQIDEEIKRQRWEMIMETQMAISLRKNQEKIGRVLEVLVERPDEEDGRYWGRTRYDAPGIDNGVLLNSERPLAPGDFVQAEIVDAFDYDLVGRVL